MSFMSKPIIGDAAGAGTGGFREPTGEERRALRADLEDFNAQYSLVLDEGDLQAWPEFFTDDAFYSVTARENFDNDMPVGLVHCEGKGMLKDRAFAIQHTAMFAPRYLRHYVTNTLALGVSEDGSIAARANYMVLETLHDDPTTHIHQAGSYHDIFVQGGDGALRLRRRICVYDSLIIPTALVLPV